MNPILKVHDLSIGFYTPHGLITAVDKISFSVMEEETIGIVGESGSGKSVTALAIMQLLAAPPAKYLSGEILFENKDLLKCNKKEIRTIRGSKISMIFQEPMTSLNPVIKVGEQIAEAFRIHLHMQHKEALEKAVDMLELVGVSDPDKRIYEYPHQMSGGMRQRIMIAIALACNPRLLIADEPTTALDVTIQAQILRLIKQLHDRIHMTTILITHDLGIVANMVDRVIVMYAGRIMEIAKVDDLFNDPLHPYTEGLLRCIPHIDEKTDTLNTIEGVVPSLDKVQKGCCFSTRCKYCQDICKIIVPELKGNDNHLFACHFDAEDRSSIGGINYE